MSSEITAWAHCPNCSGGFPKRYDIHIQCSPDETHGGLQMDCPDCERQVRMSVGNPAIPRTETSNHSEFDSTVVTELLEYDTVIVGERRHRWFVYVLECSWRPSSGHSGYEDWKFAASRASKRLYVGSTDNLARRMKEHQLTGKREFGFDSDTHFSGSEFTKKFRPKKLYEVSRVATKEKARELEERRARELESEHPDWFIWQN